MKKWVLLVVGVVLIGMLSSLGLAQEPASSILANLPPAGKYKHADAVYLRNDEEITIKADGTFDMSVHKCIWVLTPDGVGPNSAFYEYYDSRTQTAHLDYARTIHPDGTVINVFSFNVLDALVAELLQSNGMPTVPDTEDKILYFQMPSVTEGAIVDWQMTISGRDPLIPGEFSGVFYLSGAIPAESEMLTVKVAHGVEARINVVESNIKPVVQKTDEWTTYAFSATDVSAITIEPSMPALSVVAPRVVITTLTDWDQVAEMYQELFAAAVKPDASITQMVQTISCHLITRGYFHHPEMSPAPELKERTQKQPCEEFTLLEKIDALYDFVANDIDPSSTARFSLPPAPVTLSYHAGDCKGKAALLIAMLRVLGVTAYPALINTEAGADIDTSLPPTLAAFNHAIVAMRQDGKWRFLDPMGEAYSTLDYLPPQDRNRHALVITGEKDRPWILVPTDITTPENNSVEGRMDVYPALGRDCVVQAYTVTKGETTCSLDVDVAMTKPHQEEAKYEKLMSDDVRGVHDLSFRTTFLPGAEAHGNTSFKVPSHEDSQGGLWFMLPYPPPCPTPTQLVSSLGSKPRRYPYVISPEEVKITARVTVPQGMKLAGLPENVEVRNELGCFTSSYRMDESGHLLIERSLEIDGCRVPPDKVGLLRAIFTAMDSDEHTRLLFLPVRAK